METKVKLNKNSFEVKANKAFVFGQGTAGAYAFYSDAEYWIVTDEAGVSLKSLYLEVEYLTPIDEINSLSRTFKIGDKQYKYTIVE